ncbi:MAG: Transcriptional regulatory protein AfsQ1 [Anaerolineales bacterium]|nr:Transcriptional regulatory protein AfsQ1 [Anaerolineales bacterium]
MNVLAVDDDKAMTDLIAMLLQKHGFTVRTSNSARDAMRVISEGWAHAVVLDLMMPDMDGRQICKAVRAFSNVPIIILSAFNDPQIVAESLDNGADDYLVKPVPSEVLAARITRLVRRTGRLGLDRNRSTLGAWIPSSASIPTTPVKPG